MQRRQVVVRDTLRTTLNMYAGGHYSYAVCGATWRKFRLPYAREKSIIKMEIFLFARATN